MATGPRPLNPAEWEAYTLHLQRVPVEAIEEQTGLTRPRIAAAVDLGRLHAQTTLQAEATPQKPTARPQPARVRRAVIPQLPGATIPPTADLPAFTELPSYTDAPPIHSTPAPPVIEEPAPAPAPATAAAPDLDRLAHSPKVRTWAAANGWAVPVVGQRLPGGIVLAYLRAHGGNQ